MDNMSNKEKMKQLRDETGISISVCKNALEKNNWDLEGARETLREEYANLDFKKIDRETNKKAFGIKVVANLLVFVAKKLGAAKKLGEALFFVAKKLGAALLAGLMGLAGIIGGILGLLGSGLLGAILAAFGGLLLLIYLFNKKKDKEDKEDKEDNKAGEI